MAKSPIRKINFANATANLFADVEVKAEDNQPGTFEGVLYSGGELPPSTLDDQPPRTDS